MPRPRVSEKFPTQGAGTRPALSAAMVRSSSVRWAGGAVTDQQGGW